MTITGIKQQDKGDLLRFCMEARRHLTEYDKDGFGYAATNGTDMWMERWLNPDDSFIYRNPTTKSDLALIEAFENSISTPNIYSSYGVVDKSLNDATTITLHARMSTNTVSLENTHPFIKDGISLIHNGVIRNASKWKNTLSTCDSEALLTKYIKDCVQYDPSLIKGLFEAMNGYFAVSMLVPSDDGYVLDVFKCDQAQLYFARVPELGDAKVWVTDTQHLLEVCEKLGWSIPKLFSFTEHTIVRCDTVTGVPISVDSFQDDTFYSGYDYGTGEYNDEYMYEEGYLSKADKAAERRAKIGSHITNYHRTR